jgi:hypothetical protein
MPDDPLAVALDELYGADPDAFLARRTELTKQARTAGDATAAKRIGALRKPTRSAYAINRLARTDPAAVGKLRELAEQWRAAEQSVDAQQIRELTRSRRRLIDDLTRAAFAAADEPNPSSAARDEVVATLTAALSDEAVADDVERGVLVKPARWEGFGFGGPELTLVPGGSTIGPPRAPATRERPPAGPAASRPRLTPAERRAAREAEQQALAERAAEAEREAARAREAALEQARRAVDEAEDNLLLATDEEQARVDRVRELEEELTGARKAVDEARREVRRAEIAQRRAQDALRRLERDS